MSPATIRASALCGFLIRLLRDKKATDETTMRHSGLCLRLQYRPAKQLNTHKVLIDPHTPSETLHTVNSAVQPVTLFTLLVFVIQHMN